MTRPPDLDELEALDPRREADRMRGGLLDRELAGLDSAPLIDALAAADPVALAEVLVGPRADGRLTPLALSVAPSLEGALSAPALYRRLVDLAARSPDPAGFGGQVLEHIVAHHVGALWVVALSQRVEGRHAGLRHLLALESHEDFGRACLTYARVGAREGLVEVAVATARPEPLGALATVDARDALIDAAVAVARAHPQVPLVAWLAACWSPRPRALVADVAAHLDEATAAGLLALCSRP